jgi:epoxide hydrolase 4
MSEAGATHGAAGAEMIGHEFADVNGVRIHYAIARPVNKETGERAEKARATGTKLIIFLHGFPEFWYAWRKQLEEFGRDFIAVAPDMRGYNLSSKPAAVEEYDIGKLAGDVRGRYTPGPAQGMAQLRYTALIRLMTRVRSLAIVR